MKAKIYGYILLVLTGLIINSCKKDNPVPQSHATFTADKLVAAVEEDIQFTNSSTNATAFTWSFGDGTTSKDVAPKKSYQNTGTYLVSLVSTGVGGSTISTLEIKITPFASFVVENAGNLVALNPVKFTNTSKGDATYSWAFGNAAGSTSTDKDPSFSYLTAGTFTVTLTASSAEGSTSATKQVIITSAQPELYFTDTGVNLIEKLALDGSGDVNNVLDVSGKGGVGLAYDSVHGKIYFSDFEVTGSGNIWRMNLDATGLEAIVSDIADDPYGITLDITGGYIYWADDGGHISRADLDGSNKVDLITPDDIEDAQFRSNVGLDLVHHKMYFIDYWNENLWRADLDGSNPTIVVPATYGYNVFVDQVNSKIYYNDMDNDEFRRADLDGGNIETVDPVSTRIYGITMDYKLNKLYWSAYSTGEIYIADLDGSNKLTLKSGLDSPRGIFLRK